NFAVTFLPTKAFNFTQSHSLYAHCYERFLHRLGLKRLDDRFDFFHRAKLEAALQMASHIAVGRGLHRFSNFPTEFLLEFDKRNLNHGRSSVRTAVGQIALE